MHFHLNTTAVLLYVKSVRGSEDEENIYSVYHTTSINLFINSDAILNRDALWSIQGKNHHVNAAIVRGIRRTGKILR